MTEKADVRTLTNPMMMSFRFHKAMMALAILFLPIWGSVMDGRGPLGSLGGLASFYPLLLGCFIWSIQAVFFQRKIYFPKNVGTYPVLLFLLAIIISFIVNIQEIWTMNFNGAPASTRFFIQFGTMLMLMLILLYMTNFFKAALNSGQDIFAFINRYMTLSVCISVVYSFFEIGAHFLGITAFESVLSIFQLLYLSGGGYQSFRLQSLAYEPSFFIQYVVIVLPWLVVNIVYSSKKRKIFYLILTAIVCLMVFLTFSRSGYPIILLEIIMLLFFFRKKISIVKGMILICMFIGALSLLFASVGLEYDLDSFLHVFDTIFIIEGVSNITRWASQLAGWYIFLDYPITGVGWGLFGFYAPDYFPSWGWASPEIQMTGLNGGGRLSPPFGLYTRLLSEVGAVGFACFMLIFFYTTKNLYALIHNKKICELHRAFLFACVVFLTAFFVLGFTADNLYNWGAWGVVTLVWALTNRYIQEN